MLARLQLTRAASPALSFGPLRSPLLVQPATYGTQPRLKVTRFPLNLVRLIASWLCSYGGRLGEADADFAVGLATGPLSRGAANQPAAKPPPPNATSPIKRPTSSPTASRPRFGLGLGMIRRGYDEESGSPNDGSEEAGEDGSPDTGNPDTGYPETGTPDTGYPSCAGPGGPEAGGTGTAGPEAGGADIGYPCCAGIG